MEDQTLISLISYLSSIKWKLVFVWLGVVFLHNMYFVVNILLYFLILLHDWTRLTGVRAHIDSYYQAVRTLHVLLLLLHLIMQIIHKNWEKKCWFIISMILNMYYTLYNYFFLKIYNSIIYCCYHFNAFLKM